MVTFVTVEASAKFCFIVNLVIFAGGVTLVGGMGYRWEA